MFSKLWIINQKFHQDFEYRLRAVVELVPHYCNCILILVMAFERFVLMCKMEDALSNLSKRIRMYLYGGCLVLIVALPLPHLLDFKNWVITFQTHSAFLYSSYPFFQHKLYFQLTKNTESRKKTSGSLQVLVDEMHSPLQRSAKNTGFLAVPCIIKYSLKECLVGSFSRNGIFHLSKNPTYSQPTPLVNLELS